MFRIKLFRIILELKGYPINSSIRYLEKIKNLPQGDFEELINERKWEQFNFHFANNNLYRKILKNERVDRWEDIPILTKKDLQKPLREILSKGYRPNNVYCNKTSGSSGIPFFFGKDKLAHAKTWALILDRYSRHDIEYGVSLQARFYGMPLEGLGYYKERIKDFFAARVRFPVFDLSYQQLDRFTDRFRKMKFEYLNGYTSCLRVFADYLIEKNIVLKDICPSLKVCFPTSEMCSQSDREILEKGFGVKVANEYGCAEMDILAFEDEDFDWVVSNENIILEIVDEKGKILKNGEYGRIILTSLYNKAVPLIRYEIGDIGALSLLRKGNSIILEELKGRSNEFAKLPSGREVPALTFYYITKTLIHQEYGISEFVIKQISITNFIFEYVSTYEIPIEAKLKIQNALDLYLETGLLAIFERKLKIERSPSGKLKQFQNLIS